MRRSDLNLSSGSTTMMTYKGLKTEEGASINIAIAKVKFIDGASLRIVIRHLCCDWTPNLFTKWMNIINYIERFLV